MVILHVVTPAEIGGLERVVQMLSVAQHARGNAVHVALVGVDAGPATEGFLKALQPKGVTIHRADVSPSAYLGERSAIADLCARLHPDVVHTHGYRADVLDGGVGRRHGAIAVATIHGFTGGDWKNRFYEWLQRRAVRRCDAVVGVSRPLVDELVAAGVPSDRVHFIRNACAPPESLTERRAARSELGLLEEGFVIGWVGRLSPEKGLDVLLDALARLPDLPVTLAVVGGGPGRQALELHAEQLGLSGRVVWCGVVPEAVRVFPAFDLFALSSRSEGTPVVLLEAMITGIPVVATAVGGVPDLLAPDGGVLVGPEDPAALAAAIRGTFVHPAGAEVRAGIARARAQRELGVDAWAASYEEVYGGALQARRGAA
ncbi:MAG: glycosyltransferase [Gemmatimonadales bacterium]